MHIKIRYAVFLFLALWMSACQKSDEGPGAAPGQLFIRLHDLSAEKIDSAVFHFTNTRPLTLKGPGKDGALILPLEATPVGQWLTQITLFSHVSGDATEAHELMVRRRDTREMALPIESANAALDMEGPRARANNRWTGMLVARYPKQSETMQVHTDPHSPYCSLDLDAHRKATRITLRRTALRANPKGVVSALAHEKVYESKELDRFAPGGRQLVDNESFADFCENLRDHNIRELSYACRIQYEDGTVKDMAFKQ